MFEQNPNNHELALEFFRDLNKHEMYLTLVRLYFRHNMYQEISDSQRAHDYTSGQPSASALLHEQYEFAKDQIEQG